MSRARRSCRGGRRARPEFSIGAPFWKALGRMLASPQQASAAATALEAIKNFLYFHKTRFLEMGRRHGGHPTPPHL